MSIKTALVMRATGAQGRGAIKHLTKTGWHVHALVTDVSSDRAIALKSISRNITLYQGSSDDSASIETAVKGCQSLFLVQLPSYAGGSEVQEGRVILNIALAAGVQHVVFSTSLALNNPNVREEVKESMISTAVIPKADVEELVKASGLTWTLIHPGYFMTNFLPPFKERKIVNSYGPDCVLPLVDTDDIGAFVAAAFEDPEKFGGRTVTVVSENMQVDGILTQLERASGQKIEVVYRTPEETEKAKTNLFVAGQISCTTLHKWVDFEEVKNWGVPLTTFAQFLKSTRMSFLQVRKPIKLLGYINIWNK